MKTNRFILIAVILFFAAPITLTKAQILGVPQIIQEQTEWCWAASSKSVLDYYGHTTAQCTIAEYTRTVSSWHDFGLVNCCSNPNQGCNYWNYNYGTTGSIEDILYHFGNITTINMSNLLSLQEVQTEIGAGRPFIFRWGWYSGGGHFLTGYGISGTDMYYNNSLVGYGHEIANYYWIADDGVSHSWTHTQTLAPGTDVEDESNSLNTINVFPNPTTGLLTINYISAEDDIYKIVLTNILGQELLIQESQTVNQKLETSLDISELPDGIYFLNLSSSKRNVVCKIQKL